MGRSCRTVAVVAALFVGSFSFAYSEEIGSPAIRYDSAPGNSLLVLKPTIRTVTQAEAAAPSAAGEEAKKHNHRSRMIQKHLRREAESSRTHGNTLILTKRVEPPLCRVLKLSHKRLT